jgi:hypothetical protein
MSTSLLYCSVSTLQLLIGATTAAVCCCMPDRLEGSCACAAAAVSFTRSDCARHSLSRCLCRSTACASCSAARSREQHCTLLKDAHRSLHLVRAQQTSSLGSQIRKLLHQLLPADSDRHEGCWCHHSGSKSSLQEPLGSF